MSRIVGEGEPVSRRVIGCTFEVSNILVQGFLESVYENALCVDLAEQQIPFERQKELIVSYEDWVIETFVADILVARELPVELRAVNRALAKHDAQVMNYLRGTDAKFWHTSFGGMPHCVETCGKKSNSFQVKRFNAKTNRHQ